MSKAVIVFLFFILPPNMSFAEIDLQDKTIKEIIVNLESGIHFQINGSMPNPDGCNSDSWYKVDPNSNYEQAALSFLLAYEAQNKSITFKLEGCSGSYPKVKYIY